MYSSNSFNKSQDPSIVLRDENTEMNNKKKVPALLRITKQWGEKGTRANMYKIIQQILSAMKNKAVILE